MRHGSLLQSVSVFTDSYSVIFVVMVSAFPSWNRGGPRPILRELTGRVFIVLVIVPSCPVLKSWGKLARRRPRRRAALQRPYRLDAPTRRSEQHWTQDLRKWSLNRLMSWKLAHDDQYWRMRGETITNTGEIGSLHSVVQFVESPALAAMLTMLSRGPNDKVEVVTRTCCLIVENIFDTRSGETFILTACLELLDSHL